jgi:hypothetical protein
MGNEQGRGPAAGGGGGGEGECVCVFAVHEGDGGVRLDGNFGPALRRLGLRDKGLAELVFGSVPLTGQGRMFKVGWLSAFVVHPLHLIVLERCICCETWCAAASCRRAPSLWWRRL